MRIGVDARPLTLQRAGVGNYVYNLVEQLPRLAPEHDFYLYANRELSSPVSGPRVTTRIDRAFRGCPGSAWLRARAGRLARRDRLDVFWGTHPLLPRRLPHSTLKIITVYDLVWLRFADTATRYNVMVQKVWTRKALSEADIIVTISRSVKEELVEHLGVPEKRILCIYPGVSKAYKPRERESAARHIACKYGMPIHYMAAVGTIEPRKNLSVLVQMLEILKRKGELTCPLVIAGGSGWKNSSLFQQIRQARLTQNEIRFLGYLPDEELPFFYAGAELFLFPSLYEGFGIPPVEAMACGTPVIASNARCMPEVLAGAAVLESPTAPERFAEAIVNLRSDAKFRDALVSAGLRRAQQFSWRTSAKQFVDLFSGNDPVCIIESESMREVSVTETISR
jgi:glycosyltransferase involved in cell wall biosynthesis